MTFKCSNSILTAILLTFSSLFFMGNASATLIYSETVDGDLDAIGSTNVNLVAGINLIQGVINETPPAETDRIKFTQLAGLTIDSIVLSFSGVFDDANIGQSMNVDLHNNVANLFDDNFNMVNSGSDISASFFDSFGPETGPLSTTTAGAIWDFQISAGTVFPGQPWTLTINTTSDSPPPVDVPEPSTLAIFALAMAGLTARRFKKKS
ncbi:PEP-CTERM sorting domain-containing protein [Colwellia sp. Bg11-28]|uniref:PEP-CTERM sorting domain-containing protein n=1 Tax=Colwellia sp. Bg11-28 TaxID=2058305 RepID=UPI001E4DA6CE|nr:PEP-CTERM sorting domain-containing protein [Colwellia sp. Bg11-28]